MAVCFLTFPPDSYLLEGLRSAQSSAQPTIVVCHTGKSDIASKHSGRTIGTKLGLGGFLRSSTISEELKTLLTDLHLARRGFGPWSLFVWKNQRHAPAAASEPLSNHQGSTLGVCEVIPASGCGGSIMWACYSAPCRLEAVVEEALLRTG
jgi:hypothetical protein